MLVQGRSYANSGRPQGPRSSAASLPMDKLLHRRDCGLGRENFPCEHTVNFLITVKTGVLEDGAAVIQVERAPQRGEHDAAGRNAEEHQIFDAVRAQDQVEFVLRKSAHPLLMHDQLAGMRDGAVKFGRRRAFDEKIVLLHPRKWRLHLRNFRITGGKSQPHVDDLKPLLPGKLHGLGRNGNDNLRTGDNFKNPHLAIERQQRRFFRIKFLKLHDANLTQRRQDANQRSLNRRLCGFAQADNKWWPYAKGGSTQVAHRRVRR
jgi:hypothetical protein